jgi:hypothetical protein
LNTAPPRSSALPSIRPPVTDIAGVLSTDQTTGANRADRTTVGLNKFGIDNSFKAAPETALSQSAFPI